MNAPTDNTDEQEVIGTPIAEQCWLTPPPPPSPPPIAHLSSRVIYARASWRAFLFDFRTRLIRLVHCQNLGASE